MEKCSRKVNSFAVSRSVYLMGLFDWKLVSEEKHANQPSILTFERDENVPYYQEMVEIEKETSPKLIPFPIFFILLGISFALLTTYLIMWLVLKPNFDNVKFFFILFVPAMISMLGGVGISFIRTRQLVKYLQDENNIVKNAEEKMQALRAKYGNNEKKN